MKTYIDQNIVSRIIDSSSNSQFIKTLKQKHLVISFATITETFQRPYQKSIVNELEILEDFDVSYLVQNNSTKAELHDSASLVENFDTWVNTTSQNLSIKEATFNFQFTIANNFNKPDILKSINDTLLIYEQENNIHREGMEFQINGLKIFKKTIMENEFPPLNPIQHLRNITGCDSKALSAIEPPLFFQEFHRILKASEEGRKYFDEFLANLNSQGSTSNQVEFLNKELCTMGYHSDGFKKEKLRSMINDSGHLSMACFCDEFLTNDYKLSQRAKAIFKLLNCHTIVNGINLN